jgi:hypothetical protein
MARVLKYPTICYYCKKTCDPTEEKKLKKEGKLKHLSFLHRTHGKWFAHCSDCYESKKEIT